MDEQSIHMSYKSYNILCVIISCGILMWGIQAGLNFYKLLMVRAAILTDDIAVLRGLSDNLRQLKNVSTAHAQSLLHTRQAAPPARVCCVIQPIRISGATWANVTSLCIDVKFSQQLRCWFVPVAGLDMSSPPPSCNVHGKCIMDSFAAARVCSWMGKCVYLSGNDASVTLDFSDAPRIPDCGYGVLVVPDEATHTPLVIGVCDANNSNTVDTSGVSNEGAGDVEIGVGFGGGGNSTRWRRAPLQATPNGNSGDALQQNMNFLIIKYVLYEIKRTPLSDDGSMAAGDVLGDTYLHTGGSCHHKVHSIYGASAALPTLMRGASHLENTAERQQNDSEGAQRSPLAVRREGSDNNADESCVVCLTDRKEVLLLPCRHCCVCSSCLPLIDKCPVCRATFNIYLMMQQSVVTVAI